MERQRSAFIQKVRITVSRLVNKGVKHVNFGVLVENAPVTNSTDVYRVLKVIRDLGFVDAEGNFDVEAAKQWLASSRR